MAKQSPKQSQAIKPALLILGMMMLFLFIILIDGPDQTEKVKFSDFMAQTETPSNSDDRIVEVTIRGPHIEGKRQNHGKFKTYGPDNNADLGKELMEKGILVSYDEPEEPGMLKTILINSLPLILLLVVIFFMMRQLQIGGGKAMSFGKSRAKMLTETKAKVTFADIAGIDEAKTELAEIIEFLRDPKKFTKLGGRIPKGVLLVGPPGTGKTILARGVAGEAGVPFFSISGSDFVEMFVGVGASRVRDLFDQAKKNAPCIIFIDEIDAVGRQRGAGLGGGHDEREQTLNQLLVEMDGFESNEGVIVIAASNRADVLDPALLRPGRFDRRVVVPKPDVKGRIGILAVHSKKTPLEGDVNLAKIAQGTPGFSGADLENLVNEAALIAARKNCEKLNMAHFELAKDKVLMGPERRSMIMSESEKRNTSYHEAGHALVGITLRGVGLDPVHKVTIIPRGQALGVTIMLPEDDRLTITREYAEGMIQYAMGGRAAEELIFGKQTTGASDDINKATNIARKMVCQWGMSETIGPLALDDKEGQDVFLGRDFAHGRNYSEKVAAEIDKEVHRIVTTGYQKALDILKTQKDKLEAMAEALLVKETLGAMDMKKIMDGEKIVTDEELQAYQERVGAEQAEIQGIKEGKLPDLAKKPDSDDSVNIDPLPQGT